MFGNLQEQYRHWSLLQNAYRNLVPLTILNAINQELDSLEKERDQLPISSFNRLISNEIKDQPAPFIYERLGEKYRHYFIDEFQDTSRLQWRNLIPLIANALESSDTQGKRGTLLLVGDAKQAIYRWRGGRAEQFLNLIQGNPPHSRLSLRYLSKNQTTGVRRKWSISTMPFFIISAVFSKTIYTGSCMKQAAGRKSGPNKADRCILNLLKEGKSAKKTSNIGLNS